MPSFLQVLRCIFGRVRQQPERIPLRAQYVMVFNSDVYFTNNDQSVYSSNSGNWYSSNTISHSTDNSSNVITVGNAPSSLIGDRLLSFRG